MPYIKEKYVNGAIVKMNRREQAIMPPRRQDQVIKADDIDLISPVENTAGFTGFKYEYIAPKPKKTETPAYISNSKDYLEINSMADVILGSFNPNMKHYTNTNVNKIRSHYEKWKALRKFLNHGNEDVYDSPKSLKFKHFKRNLEDALWRMASNLEGHIGTHYFYKESKEAWAELGKGVLKNTPYLAIPMVGPIIGSLKTLFVDLPSGKLGPIGTNLMIDIGETVDIYTSIVRGVIQTAADPIFESFGINLSDEVPSSPNAIKNIETAVVQAITGDEEGRKNFDWEIDTPMSEMGDLAVNFGLELFFDFDNMIQRAAKKGTKVATKLDLKDIDDIDNAATNFYLSLSKSEKLKILNAVKANNPSVNIDNIQSAIEDMFKESFKQHIKKNYRHKTNEEQLLALNKLINQHEYLKQYAEFDELNKALNKAELMKFTTEDKLRVALNQSFSKIYLKNFEELYGNANMTDIAEALERSLSAYSDKANEMILAKISSNIIASLGLDLHAKSSAISKYLLKLGGIPSGITPALMGSRWVKETSGKLIRKANTIDPSSGGFLKAGSIKGVAETIRDNNIAQKAFLNPEDYSNQTMLAANIDTLSYTLDILIKDVKKYLNNKEYQNVPQVIRKTILNRFQGLSSTKRITIDELITDLEALVYRIKKEYGTGVITQVGLEEQIEDLKAIQIIVKEYLPDLNQSLKYIEKHTDEIKEAQTIDKSYRVAKALESDDIFTDPMINRSGKNVVELYQEYKGLHNKLKVLTRRGNTSGLYSLKAAVQFFKEHIYNNPMNKFHNSLLKTYIDQFIDNLLGDRTLLKILQTYLGDDNYNFLISKINKLKSISIEESIFTVIREKKKESLESLYSSKPKNFEELDNGYGVYTPVYVAEFEQDVVGLITMINSLLNSALKRANKDYDRYTELDRFFKTDYRKSFEALESVKDSPEVFKHIKTIRTSTIENTRLSKKAVEVEGILSQFSAQQNVIKDMEYKITHYQTKEDLDLRFKDTERIRTLKKGSEQTLNKRLKRTVLKEPDMNTFVKKYGVKEDSPLHINKLPDILIDLKSLKQELLSKRYVDELQMDELISNISLFIKQLNRCTNTEDENIYMMRITTLNNLKNKILNSTRTLEGRINGVNRLDIHFAGLDEAKAAPIGKHILGKDLDAFAVKVELEILKDRSSKSTEEYANIMKKRFREEFKDDWKEIYDSWVKAVKTRSTRYDRDRYRNIQYNLADPNTVYNQIVQAISELDISGVTKSWIDAEETIAMYSIKFDQHYIKDTLNNLPSVKHLLTDPSIRHLIDNFEHYKDLSEEQIKLLKTLRFMKLTLQNYNRFIEDIDTFVNTIPSEDLPKYNNLKTTITSVVENYERKEVNKLMNIDSIVEDIYERINSVQSTLDPSYKSLKLDALMYKHSITDQMVINELSKIKNLDSKELQRHTALYDTMLQIMITEKELGTKFEGIMLDIETTGLSIIKDQIISITALQKDAQGNYTVIFSNSVKGKTMDEIKQYLPMSHVLESMGIKQSAFKDLLLDPKQSINESTLLLEFYHKLLYHKQKLPIYTFNGDRFDWKFLNTKADYYIKGLDLNKFEEMLMVRGIMPFGKSLKEKQSLRDVLSAYGQPIDVLKKLTADRYSLSEKYKPYLWEIFKRQIDRAQRADILALAEDLHYKNIFLGGISKDLIDDYSSTLYSIIKQYEVEESLHTKLPKLKYSDMNVFDNKVEDALFEDASDISKKIFKKKLRTNTTFTSETQEIFRNHFKQLQTDLQSELRAVKEFNTYFKEHPILQKRKANGEYYLDLEPEILKELNDQIKNSVRELNPELADSMPDITFSNLLQTFFIGSDEYPVYMTKKFSVENAKAILDIPEDYITIDNYGKIDDYVRKIINNYETLTNYKVLVANEGIIDKALEYLKNSHLRMETDLIRLDNINVREKYAVLETVYNAIYKSSNANIKVRLANEKVLVGLENEVPEIADFIKKGEAHILVNTNTDIPVIDNYQQFRLDTTYLQDSAEETLQDLKFHQLKYNMRKVTDENELYRATTTVGQESLKHTNLVTNVVNHVFDLFDATYDEAGKPTRATTNMKNTDRKITEVISAWTLNQLLISPLSEVQKFVIGSGSAHTVTFKRPNNNLFNNIDYFNHFLDMKQELKVLYKIDLSYDELTQRVTLKPTKDAVIKFNKDKLSRKTYFDIDGTLQTGYRYTLDGEPMYDVLFQEVPLESLHKYIGQNKEYVEAVYEARKRLIEQNPMLSGRLGLTNYKERYEKVHSDKQIMPVIKSKKQFIEEQATYFNDWALGNVEGIQEFVPGMTADYINILGMLAQKQINHSHSYHAYGQFVAQAGLGLDSDLFKNMDIEQFISYMKASPELVIVYFEHNKNAVGNFTLRKLNTYDPKVVTDVMQRGGRVIDWGTYEVASEAINKFNYSFEDNIFYKVWRKLVSVYKIGVLLNGVGPFIRNFLDSNMKNLFEGETVPETVSTTIQSFNVLRKYNADLRNIRKLNPYKKYSFNTAQEYFKTHETYLDQETFNFVYNFLTHNGANSINAGLQNLIDLGMYPNRWLEDTVRFTQYNLLLRKELPHSEIMRKITQTHFNYNNKTLLGNPDLQVLNIKPLNFGLKIDDIIPFYTYQISNISYVAHLLSEKPHLVEAYLDYFDTIYNLEDYDFDEYANNISLQMQFTNGNIPLKYIIPGWEDQKTTRIVNTKYGPKEQEVINTAVLKTGSSLLDGLYAYYDPITSLLDTTVSGVQFITDTIRDTANLGWGSISDWTYNTKEEVDEYFNKNYGSTSVQAFINAMHNTDITDAWYARQSETLDKKIASMLPLGSIAMNHKYNMKNIEEKTGNNIISKFPSVIGATSRWGEFKQTTPQSYSYPKKPSKSRYKKYTSFYSKNYATSYRLNGKGQSVKYYLRYPQKVYFSGRVPYTSYQRMLSRIYSPNTAHRHVSNFINSNMQTIPQYLYSYAGRNRQGKSKLLSWARMNTRFKVKSTLRRIATP